VAYHRELEVVALAVRRLRRLLALGAIRCGIDVRAPDQEEGVNPVDQARGPACVDRKEHGEAAGALDCPDVGVGHEVGRLIPEAPAGLLSNGTDPDNRKDRLRRLAHSARVPSR
jgi:hypothetical protein